MNGDRDLHEMSRVIGGLQNAVETMTNLWTAQEAIAVQGRRVLHDKVEALRTDLHTMSARVDSMGVQVNLIEPSVKAFNEEKLRQEGAKRLGKFLIAAMTTAAGLVGWAAHELIGYFFHK